MAKSDVTLHRIKITKLTDILEKEINKNVKSKLINMT